MFRISRFGSKELFDKVSGFYRRLRSPFLERCSSHELRLKTGSRVVSLPCSPGTIRGFANVHMLVIDEAARVPDELYRTVRPMLAVSDGSLICMSTPHGRHGFYWDAWARGGDEWQRVEVPASAVPRISPDFLAQERRCLGDSYFRQEYECSFETMEGLVYPDFKRCVAPGPVPAGERVGGLDFGFRNPFAAVWGVLDRDDVLWLTDEHYVRQQPLSWHMERLPREVTWYADPAGAADICAMRRGGFSVRQGLNAIAQDIAAVSARINDGSLRVLAGRCPELLAEAALYRYADDGHSEAPCDSHNHALGGLRYLLARRDRHRPAHGSAPAAPPAARRSGAFPEWWDREELWTRVF